MSLGRTIRTARKNKKLTQKELANKLNVDITYLSKIENDRTGTPPSEELLIKLANTLNLDRSIKYLSGRINEEEKETFEIFIKANYKYMNKFFDKIENDKNFVKKLLST